MSSFSSSKSLHSREKVYLFVVISILARGCIGHSFVQTIGSLLFSRSISFSSLSPRKFTGFPLSAVSSLQGIGLEPSCEQVLYQPVNCDEIVSTLGGRVYHTGWNDSVVIASICDSACEASLATIHRRVTGACAKTSEIMPGYPALALIDSIYTGWNETCLKDDKNGKYCNGMKS
jgi:hypothetical protein